MGFDQHKGKYAQFGKGRWARGTQSIANASDYEKANKLFGTSTIAAHPRPPPLPARILLAFVLAPVASMLEN
jgi:hypothetical protein